MKLNLLLLLFLTGCSEHLDRDTKIISIDQTYEDKICNFEFRSSDEFYFIRDSCSRYNIGDSITFTKINRIVDIDSSERKE